MELILLKCQCSPNSHRMRSHGMWCQRHSQRHGMWCQRQSQRRKFDCFCYQWVRNKETAGLLWLAKDVEHRLRLVFVKDVDWSVRDIEYRCNCDCKCIWGRFFLHLKKGHDLDFNSSFLELPCMDCLWRLYLANSFACSLRISADRIKFRLPIRYNLYLTVSVVTWT